MADEAKKDEKLKRDLIQLLRDVFIGNPFKRFATTVFVVGGTLIGGEDIWQLITDHLLMWHAEWSQSSNEGVVQAEDTRNEGDWLTVRNSGLLLCAIGIALHVFLFCGEQFSKFCKKVSQRRKLKAQLVGKLRDIVRGFADPSLQRSAGFMSDDLREAKRIANDLKPHLRGEILEDPIFAIVVDPKLDASGVNPYLDVSSNELAKFAERLQKS